jgi:hypothetical protein
LRWRGAALKFAKHPAIHAVQDEAFRAAGGGGDDGDIGRLHAFGGNPLARPLAEADSDRRSHPAI